LCCAWCVSTVRGVGLKKGCMEKCEAITAARSGEAERSKYQTEQEMNGRNGFSARREARLEGCVFKATESGHLELLVVSSVSSRGGACSAPASNVGGTK
jgi:hypothetical protein